MTRRAEDLRTFGRLFAFAIFIAAGVGLIADVLAQAVAGSPAVATPETFRSLQAVGILCMIAFEGLWIVHIVWVINAVACARDIARPGVPLPTPAWALLGHILPVAALWLPFKYARALKTAADLRDLELRGASKRRANKRENDPHAERARVGLWWATSLSSLLVASYGMATSQLAIAGIALALSSLLWADVVLKISSGLAERAVRLDLGAVSGYDAEAFPEDLGTEKKRRTRKPRRLLERG